MALSRVIFLNRPADLKQARKMVTQSVRIYNQEDRTYIPAARSLACDAVNNVVTMHSGSNSPTVIVRADDTSSGIKTKVAASNVDMVGVTMY
jgi:hypothetical protein